MELAQRLVALKDEDRDALLREYYAIADIGLAHILKDICLEGWSSDPSLALRASECLKHLVLLNSDAEILALHFWALGLESLIKGEMEAAIDALDRSQQGFLRISQSKLAANTQVSKLIALAMLGRYEEAVECGLRARAIFELHSDPLAIGKIEHNVGNIFFRRDRYKEAEEYQRSARAHFEEAGDLIQLAKIENSLALTLSQQHLTKAAEQLYEQALERAMAAGLKSTQAEIESSVGTLALYQGYYDRALDYLERSRRKYAELEVPHLLAMTEQEIADAYLELNLTPEAIEIYRKVAGRFSELGMHAEEARTLAYHGRAEISMGNFRQARPLLSKARELYIEEGNQVGAALVELTEAQLCYAEGDYVSSQAAARHAEIILAQAGNPRRVVFARWLQGEAARLGQEAARAETLLNSALADAKVSEQPDIVARCYTSLGLMARARGNNREAEQHYVSAIEVVERLRAPLPGEEFRSAFFADKLVPYTELARVKLSATPPEIKEAFISIENARSRSLVDILGGSVSVGLRAQDAFDDDLIEALNEKRHELNYFYNQLNQPSGFQHLEMLQSEIRQRENAVAEITRQLRHRKKVRGVPGDALDLESLQKALGEERALVEFVNLNDELLAFVVTNTGVGVIGDLAPLDGIDEDVEKFRFQIDSLRFGSAAIRNHLPALTTRIQQHLNSLYRKLIAPILPLIENRDLVIVPTGKLHYLPFHALHDGEHYLIETQAVSYAASATVLQQCLLREPSEIRKALIAGVADERAPEIYREVEKLRELFNSSDVLIDSRATRKELTVRSLDADLIHLACHARFRADNPQFSALRIGDGWLTVSDIYGLRLRSGLVTLSACETGINAVAPGEELLGLARGFLSAGSASVLLSLWRVDDEATLLFMLRFYSLLVTGMSPAKALQEAQVGLLEIRRHPFFWSPFVLVGHW